jgi:hypothetical protein
MADPCTQGKALDKIDRKVDGLVEAVQALAVQRNEIEHLIKTQGDHRDWLKGHEARLQAIERRADLAGVIEDLTATSKALDTRLKIVESRPGIYAGKILWLQLATFFTLGSALLAWVITK